MLVRARCPGWGVERVLWLSPLSNEVVPEDTVPQNHKNQRRTTKIVIVQEVSFLRFLGAQDPEVRPQGDALQEGEEAQGLHAPRQRREARAAPQPQGRGASAARAERSSAQLRASPRPRTSSSYALQLTARWPTTATAAIQPGWALHRSQRRGQRLRRQGSCRLLPVRSRRPRCERPVLLSPSPGGHSPHPQLLRALHGPGRGIALTLRRQLLARGFFCRGRSASGPCLSL